MLSTEILKKYIKPSVSYSFKKLEEIGIFSTKEMYRLRGASYNGKVKVKEKKVSKKKSQMFVLGSELMRWYEEEIINGGKLEVSKN